ncbi:Ni/Fe-hydrogenase, b-type cytochrome subunit [Desulfurobacterium sp.]|uniref:Ni/Fe-hydrogenase, b-type cytochrome subunit n=1 Tax=Desulfurobacterium sp. TaxID=2004706 RepID=UPI00263958CA|nr:Ni/Fe-hydrogenase, b-type cytochrome subunit [Desulfurobacterium sp.]
MAGHGKDYEKVYVWSVLLRVYHWVFALSIFVLIATGLYIDWPWTNTWMEGSHQWPMAMARYIHFVAGMLFTMAVITRIYLWFFGNKHEKVWDFAPITPRNIKNMITTSFHYAYLTDSHEHRTGHNAMAGMSYIMTILLAVVQFITGFYLLYPENSFFVSLGSIFGTQQTARFIHHILNWYFAIFALVHIYIASWNDIRHPEGLISSIFTGYKFFPKDHQ